MEVTSPHPDMYEGIITFLNPFLTSIAILNPMKIAEKQKFSSDSREYEIGTLAKNRLIKLEIQTEPCFILRYPKLKHAINVFSNK